MTKSIGILTLAAFTVATVLSPRQSEYRGYLITTFTDDDPAVQFHLSVGNDPKNYSFSNGGKALLTSTVGTKAVRDVFLISKPDRSKWWILGTDLDVRASGFNWDDATRHGSRALVIWESENLLDWSQSQLVTVENADAGYVWAPSAVWDDLSSQFHVFWSSKTFAAEDPDHSGSSSLDKIRTATTNDFINFSPPQDYYAPSDTALIDQEFQYLGKPGHFARFFKNETVNYVTEEVTTDGLFGTWSRVGKYVSSDRQYEGPAAFRDNQDENKYYILCDNYAQYDMFETSDVLSGRWTRSEVGNGFPSGLKHGSVTPLMSEEYDAFAARYPA